MIDITVDTAIGVLAGCAILIGGTFALTVFIHNELEKTRQFTIDGYEKIRLEIADLAKTFRGEFVSTLLFDAEIHRLDEEIGRIMRLGERRRP